MFQVRTRIELYGLVYTCITHRYFTALSHSNWTLKQGDIRPFSVRKLRDLYHNPACQLENSLLPACAEKSYLRSTIWWAWALSRSFPTGSIYEVVFVKVNFHTNPSTFSLYQ